MMPADIPGLPEEFILYLARHATPDRTRLDLPYHLPPGPDLTDKGRVEAAELGHFLHSVGAGHILASPLERTTRTAKIAAEIGGSTFEENIDLAEHRPEEKEADVLARVQRAFQLGVKLSAGHGTVALVSHGSPVLILLKWLGLPPEIIERSRIYDGRNLIPMGGAWMVRNKEGQLFLRLAFVPSGVRQPLIEEEIPAIPRLL